MNDIADIIKQPIKPKILESTPEIEKVRLAYKALRKTLRGQGVEIPFIGITKRKGVYGIKINLTDKNQASLVPVIQDDVPIHKIRIVKPLPLPAPTIIGSTDIPNSKFKIEKVKWSWPRAVASKNVYRDDEFVRTKTKDEALEATGFLLNRPKGLTYTITVLRDGEYFTYYRHTMPCLGGLVKYRDSHGEKYFMNSYFPRDIYVAFPEGEITFIGYHRQKANDFKTPYSEFIFSQESPWVSAFGSKDTVIFENNYFVLTNMQTDPTVFYSLMRLGGLVYHGAQNVYGANPNSKFNPKAEILFGKTAQADPRRLAGQKPIRISGGTWAEGFGYTRPYNESIFKTSLPHKLAEFGKLKGYPQAAHSDTYFIEAMKKNFGIEIGKVQLNDKKVHDVFVEAWDYFKEMSKELDE